MSIAIPSPKRWTVEECYRLQEAGHLEGRYELIEGVIVDKMGQNPRHARFLSNLILCLESIFSMKYIRVQAPIALPTPYGTYNEPEPDAVVTKESVITYTHHPLPDDLLLVAEVSDSSLDFDRRTKVPLYAKAGITEFWILDVAERKLYVYQEPTETGYRLTHLYTEQDAVVLAALPEKQIAVKDLFPPVE